MKLQYILALTLLVTTSCSKGTFNSVYQETTPGQINNTTTSADSSVGTRGGGGILVSTFKAAALQAKAKMTAVTQLLPNDPANQAINDFYSSRRSLWVAALNQIVTDPAIAEETNDSLKDRGLNVAAMSLPADNPTYIVLSSPMLTTGLGFTAEAAFILAVHEACHLINPDMTDNEHQFLDQIGLTLFTTP